MNNRTLWQLTAGGVADLRDSQEERRIMQRELKLNRQRQLILEELERSVCDNRVSIDDLATRIFQLANRESDRVLISHDFELSSENTVEDNYKVYTAR
ncbi:hypothetical protein ACX6FB_003563 [Vibrio cholerae]|uniref:Uncharacterized protein n=1 Tax=Vibrio cholerae TaxID=666 RepID=A0ABD7SG94_VIBCL|nr:hypothetical protein [Vibrio cholerae]EJL6311176.1 hypothetical protein [Vibrio cholerae]EKF9288578.1 hypothetical protein [Vibrio cholerae]EKF9478013.1 hypothetical protein [Vibrio cholerae]EKF9843175.1 hypothetical protein [Vibrio cholerae]ELA6198927.1 hypothetical protein [Vibrio cholerae]